MYSYEKYKRFTIEVLHDNIDKWAKKIQKSAGLAYFAFEKEKKIQGKGPIGLGKFFGENAIKLNHEKFSGAKIGDSIFLSCGINPNRKNFSIAEIK